MSNPDFSRTLLLKGLPGPLLSHLGSRDAAVWVLDSFFQDAGADALAQILRLPWKVALCEIADSTLIELLEKNENAADPLVRQRGFIQVVDTNPADVLLPPRCLPIYLLNGRDEKTRNGGLAGLTRRLTMLEALRRSEPKQLLILAGSGAVLPQELTQLWEDGLRTIVTVVSDSSSAVTELEEWRRTHSSGNATALLSLSSKDFSEELLLRYTGEQVDDRLIVRIRAESGEVSRLEITGLDDPEHPVLANYELLQERDLRSIQASDLSMAEVHNFFSHPSAAWRPYAAGLPWARDDQAWPKLRALLRRLDRDGPEAGRIAFISAESGAGATTLLRVLAWAAAEEGYPTLVAGPAPFAPKALELTSFMTRVVEVQRSASTNGRRLYEAPWLLVYDREHWEGREDEIRQFLRELERSGRPACVLVVTGPYLGADYYNSKHFTPIVHLSHEVPLDRTISLGRHLNRYLAPHGPVRSESEWRAFFDATSVEAHRGIAAFWIVLSFWVQRQFDMKETIQSWIYRQFKNKISDDVVRRAIIDIAGLTTERYPLPETMLPRSVDWPVSQKIEDIRRDVPGLALARIARNGDRYWAMAHDVIGRYLINALFYDYEARSKIGFSEALNPEHLRFLILRHLSRQPILGYLPNRTIAEEFAISIFKIDPDHGHATFTSFWREALEALDEMPAALRNTSRAFRHHTAISRRRISKQRDLFSIDIEERIALLERAAADIRYALDNIPPTPGDESDLHLYNSLAHAYQDLADEEAERGAPQERVRGLREKANDATQRAYRADPDNSFVVETYARSLISDAVNTPQDSVEKAVEVLNIVYAAIARDKSGQRRFALGKLAESAIRLLLDVELPDLNEHEVSTDVEALVVAIRALAYGVRRQEGMELADYPEKNRRVATKLLAHTLLLGNPQAVRLRYALLCLDSPTEFRSQLELLQSLQDGSTVFSPQMRLELALLLQQCDRHHEAQRAFRELRRLWKEGDHYVEVPDRLRWLVTSDGHTRRQVTAKIAGSFEHRTFAKVRDMQDAEVPFRPQEFGQDELRPGSVIRGLISFGHNGPFLRPTTAAQV